MIQYETGKVPECDRGFTNGGWGRNRTGVRGVAVRCMTTLPPSQKSYKLT